MKKLSSFLNESTNDRLPDYAITVKLSDFLRWAYSDDKGDWRAPDADYTHELWQIRRVNGTVEDISINDVKALFDKHENEVVPLDISMETVRRSKYYTYSLHFDRFRLETMSLTQNFLIYCDRKGIQYKVY